MSMIDFMCMCVLCSASQDRSAVHILHLCSYEMKYCGHCKPQCSHLTSDLSSIDFTSEHNLR